MKTKSASDFLKFSLESAIREQAALWESWKIVEAKAQTTSAAAGVYVAAGFAYLLEKADAIGIPERTLASIILILLACSIVYAIQATRVVNAPSPHMGAKGLAEVLEILKVTQPPDSLEARYDNLLSDTAKHWFEANSALEATLRTKSLLLKRSQLFLILAVVVVVPLVITVVI